MLLPKNIQDSLSLIERNIPIISQGDPDWGQAFERAIENYQTKKEIFELPYLLQLKRYPVSIDTFIHAEAYLSVERGVVWPAVIEELKKINNPDGARVVNPFTELLATGAIGSAKTTTALYTVAYQIYVLSCFKDPHRTFGLDPASEILFIFQAIGGAATSDYQRLYHMVQASPYFNSISPYKKNLASKLVFPNRIEVAVMGGDAGSIGQNVMGGLVDEMNFMAMIASSKRAYDGQKYDQARTVYNGIARRRKSRFLKMGKAPGILCLVSSKRYPGEFTDQKLQQAKTDKTIYVYDKTVWQMKPEGTFNSGWFQLHTGTSTTKPVVITPENTIKYDPKTIVQIPNEFRQDFKDDLIGSLRDIAGISVVAQYPFLTNGEAVGRMFGKVKSVLNTETTDMETEPLQFFPNRFRHINRLRWAHVDLGLTSDSAGVACGYVPEFVVTEDGLLMPRIEFDFLLQVRPPPNKEIQFYKIRNLLVKLFEAGLPIKYVTFDSYQSADSIQLLRQLGFSTGTISTVDNLLPYMITKTAIYQDRVWAPTSLRCQGELLSLEMYSNIGRKGKIDHPPNGSKDVADAFASVIHGLTMRRETWADHGVPVNQAVAVYKEVITEESKHGTAAASSDYGVERAQAVA